ncbi:Kinesin-like protein KIN-12B, partial [Mucuna pruriens]
STKDSAKVKLEQEKGQWTEAESRWTCLTEKLRSELEASRSLAEKRKQELDTERKCAEELNKTMQVAIKGHARILEQYADLEEKHIQLLERHRKLQDGIDDVKKAASREGVRGAESKFINALAAEISALKAEKEKERQILIDENRGLHAQLKDTAEAVQASGELLVRLKEAEDSVVTAQKQAMDAEQEAAKAYKQIDKLKKKHEKEISTLNELLAKTHLPNEEIQPTFDDLVMPTYDDTKVPHNVNGQIELFCNEEDSELAKLAEQSWFSGYDTQSLQHPSQNHPQVNNPRNPRYPVAQSAHATPPLQNHSGPKPNHHHHHDPPHQTPDYTPQTSSSSLYTLQDREPSPSTAPRGISQ